MPPRKLVFVNRFFHPDSSATSQMLSDLAMRLAQAGVTVHVVTSRQLYEDPRALLAPLERVGGVTVHRIWTARFGRARLLGRALDYASFYVSSAFRLLLLLRRADVLVVKTDPPLLAVVVAGIARLRRAVLVNWLQDVFPEVASRLGAVPLPRIVDAVLRGLRDRTLHAARANVVLGTRMQDYLVARGIPRQRLRIIENWACGAVRPADDSALRARLQLSDRFVVAYSGNLGRAHEFDTLLDAAQRLRDAPVTFLMIGGGSGMRELQQQARERGLASFVFLPYQPREQLADSLAAADVHFVSLRPELEGLIVPSKVYGILAAGRPPIFIGDEDGEVARLLRDTRCGLCVRSGDGAGLAHALNALRADREEVLRLGQRARAVFDRCFTVEGALEKWTALLQELEEPRTAAALIQPGT